MGNSSASLNQDSGIDATIPEAGGSGASAVGSVAGGPRKTDEIRGGFVLRAKSDEQPSRRRSLVERTGMKTFVQVISLMKVVSLDLNSCLTHNITLNLMDDVHTFSNFKLKRKVCDLYQKTH